MAHLGGPALFGQLLWAETQRRGWEWAEDKEVVGDAASWVWKVTEDYFYDGRQAVDFVVSSVDRLVSRHGAPVRRGSYATWRRHTRDQRMAQVGAEDAVSKAMRTGLPWS